jgi:hypothetical protein
MSPDEIIREACKLPLPALDKVAQVLGFEVLGRQQESNENKTELGRCPQ